MGRFLLFAMFLSLVTAPAAAQGTSAHDWFAGYQQVAGVIRPLRGAVVGLVFHRESVTAGVLTVSTLRESDSIEFANGDLRTETTSALHLGAGGRWHKPHGRVTFFAQAEALVTVSLASTMVRSAAHHGGVVEAHRDVSVDPLLQAGFGATIKASNRVGLTGSFELHAPVLHPHIESLHYRGTVGLSVRVGGS